MDPSNPTAGSNPQIPLVRVAIADLRQDPGNARSHDRRNLDAIRDSLQTFGQVLPVVVRHGQIVGGNATAQAALELGWTHLDATPADHLSEPEAVALAIALNRTAELADWDTAVLLESLQGLPTLEGTGFTAEELAELEAAVRGEGGAPGLTDPDAVPEPPAEPVTRPGDLWLLGPHRLLCGDATKAEDVERLMAGEVVNVAVTSPPYASQRTYDEESGFKPISPDDYVDWFEDVQANVGAVLAEDGSWFVNMKEHSQEGQRHLYVKDLTIAHVRRWGWRFVDEMCWVDSRNGVPGTWPNRFKNAWEPIFHYARTPSLKFRPDAVAHRSDGVRTYDPAVHWGTGVEGYAAPSGQPKTHQGMALPSNVVRAAAGGDGLNPAAFPVALPTFFVRAYSDLGDAILDQFAGSGSTLLAAHQEGRVGYALEISSTYCDTICRRWQEHTGIKPILEATGEPHDFTSPP